MRLSAWSVRRNPKDFWLAGVLTGAPSPAVLLRKCFTAIRERNARCGPAVGGGGA